METTEKSFTTHEKPMQNNPSFLSQLLLHWQISKKSFYAFVSLLFISLLAYNCVTIFCIHITFLAKDPAIILPEYVAGKTRTVYSLPASTKLPSAVQYSSKEVNCDTLLHNRTTKCRLKRRKRYKNAGKILETEDVNQFEVRVMEFFKPSFCKFKFFMTWISSLESFGDREMFSVESLFKAHPNGCLIIASNTLDSRNGMQILRPFSEVGFKVTAISPDFNYLFNNTAAQAWYKQLKRGNVNPGEVSLGQNLSNLLRIGLLYRFGGIYLDTDIIVLRSFGELKNAIGAQSVDHVTGNWSRLNNAVMIFDKGHPLLHEFIQEFALTFDGNKWGHNGPYLVSRVVSRLSGSDEFDLTVLPPIAFYPVDWSRIGSLFKGPRSSSHSKWLDAKLRQIQRQSFAVHLWNKQSRKFKAEKGSIIEHIMLSYSVSRNSSSVYEA